jgi:TetR/AcrR family transcriptional regulator
LPGNVLLPAGRNFNSGMDVAIMNNDRPKDGSGKTAGRILSAAGAMFAERGYDGTRMDEIALRAGVNKATIYYQIGDKDTLYAEVIHSVIGDVAKRIIDAVKKADSPEAKLRAYITCIAQSVDKNPDLPPIMMREVISGGRHLPKLVIEDIVSVITALMNTLDEGTKKGVFVETIPYLVHVMIIGTILLYKRTSPLIEEIQNWLPAGIKKRQSNLKANIADEAVKLILKAVKKPRV